MRYLMHLLICSAVALRNSPRASSAGNFVRDALTPEMERLSNSRSLARQNYDALPGFARGQCAFDLALGTPGG